jgi:hypothetical protein
MRWWRKRTRGVQATLQSCRRWPVMKLDIRSQKHQDTWPRSRFCPTPRHKTSGQKNLDVRNLEVRNLEVGNLPSGSWCQKSWCQKILMSEILMFWKPDPSQVSYRKTWPRSTWTWLGSGFTVRNFWAVGPTTGESCTVKCDGQTVWPKPTFNLSTWPSCFCKFWGQHLHGVRWSHRETDAGGSSHDRVSLLQELWSLTFEQFTPIKHGCQVVFRIYGAEPRPLRRPEPLAKSGSRDRVCASQAGKLWPVPLKNLTQANFYCRIWPGQKSWCFENLTQVKFGTGKPDPSQVQVDLGQVLR